MSTRAAEHADTAISRLEDLAALVADHRAQGHADASVPTDQLVDWLVGWRADRVRLTDAEEERDRWRRRARRQTPHPQAVRGARRRGGR